MTRYADKLPRVGWREWAQLPALGIPAIKAKVDTGARTSALHAFQVRHFRHHSEDWVRFFMHPLQHDTDTVVECRARVIDRRAVSDSGGHREKRWVVETDLRIGTQTWPVELTLTNRDTMLFRMLLGRTALRGRLLVDCARSYLQGSKPDLSILYPDTIPTNTLPEHAE